MTFAAFHAAVDGYVTANTSPTTDAPSDEECLAALAEEMAAGRA